MNKAVAWIGVFLAAIGVVVLISTFGTIVALAGLFGAVGGVGLIIFYFISRNNEVVTKITPPS